LKTSKITFDKKWQSCQTKNCCKDLLSKIWCEKSIILTNKLKLNIQNTIFVAMVTSTRKEVASTWSISGCGVCGRGVCGRGVWHTIAHLRTTLAASESIITHGIVGLSLHHTLILS